MTDKSPAALVTGAARRVGRAIALGLAADGWAVAVHYNSGARDARSAVAAIERAGGRAVAIKADLRDERAVKALVPRAARALGPISCLINNASVFEKDSVQSATRKSWDLHLAVNLRAPFLLMQALATQVPPRGRAAVVNIIDERVWNLTPYFVSYTVSKSGLWTLTQSMALALAPRIRVNAVGPGPTLPSKRQSKAQFRRQWSSLPLARPASPEEIAQAVRFLVQAPSVTGQMIAVDGGQHLGWGQAGLKGGTDE